MRGNVKADAAANTGFWEEIQMFPFLLAILGNTSMSFKNVNGSLNGMSPSTTNYKRCMLVWVYGLEVLESSGMGRMF